MDQPVSRLVEDEGTDQRFTGGRAARVVTVRSFQGQYGTSGNSRQIKIYIAIDIYIVL